MSHRNDDANICQMAIRGEATVADLYRTAGKAELVHGDLVVMSPGGGTHGRAALAIVASLREYERRTRRGYAIPDNVGFLVRLQGRRSFSPDAAFHPGPIDEKFIEGAPVFAVEVRSPEDVGPGAERMMAAKRADYFAAGTLVVWDVDVTREGWVRVYRASDPENPTVHRRGDIADAEPALPGWVFPVDDLFA